MDWQQLPLDRIYYDATRGVPGTIWPIGTPGVPSNTIADVITICAARNINKVHVTGTLAIGAGIAQDLVGHNTILTGQTAGSAYVRDFSGYLEVNAMVGGTLDIYADAADIVINVNCTGGAINIYGNAQVVDNSVAGCTVNNYAVAQNITEDGIYVDSRGLAGTTWPIGTSGSPVNNLADAITIATARGLYKLYFLNPGDTFTAIGDMDNWKLVGPSNSPFGGATTGFVPFGFSFLNAVFENLWVSGTLLGSSYFLNCYINVTISYGGTFKDCQIYDINIGDDGYQYELINCYGNEYVSPFIYINHTDCNIIISGYRGYLWIKRSQDGSNVIEVYSSNMKLWLDNTNTAGTFDIYGDVTIVNDATATVKDHTNNPKSETAVNITAILASETNFLNLAVAGLHYTIDDLVLKCANPGANTVNVKLYKLVNGVLTNTLTFAITAANFGTYFDINTMFGLKSLAGDNIKITVQTTAGGPYAVTGSYAHRSA